MPFVVEPPVSRRVNYWSNQFSTMVTLGDERAGAWGWYLTTPIGIDTSPDGDKRYFIESQAMNGAWREDLQYMKIAGQWEYAIRVVELSDSKGNVTGKILTTDISRGFPTVDGKVDWEENPSRTEWQSGRLGSACTQLRVSLVPVQEQRNRGPAVAGHRLCLFCHMGQVPLIAKTPRAPLGRLSRWMSAWRWQKRARPPCSTLTSAATACACPSACAAALIWRPQRNL